MTKDLKNNDLEFFINPNRLKYLLELFNLSSEKFLKLLQGKNKNPILNLEELRLILDKKQKTKLSIIKKIDNIFERGFEWYISRRNLPEKEKLSLFFRKKTFNADLNLGSIKKVDEFEKKKIEIETLCNSIKYRAERKLIANLNETPSDVAKRIKKEFFEVEKEFKTGKKLKSSKKDRDYLENLIRVIEQFNVFVFEFVDKKKKEDLKSIFNGFFMAPNLIVIKRQQDSLKREIFTLMHEFAHYLLNLEEIDEIVGEGLDSNSNKVEKWCNDFAYYFLIGDYDLKLTTLTEATQENDFHKKIIDEITQNTHISNFALYTRLRINNKISQKNYQRIYETIQLKIFEDKQKRKVTLELEKEKAKESGKELYFSQPKPIESNLFKEIVKINYFEGKLSESAVLDTLNIKNKLIEEVIYS